jgi:hypothetical protein
MFAKLDARYHFTRQFLASAFDAAAWARRIEYRYGTAEPPPHVQVRHLGAVTSAVLHSVAALESDVWSLLHHGPGHQLGSNGIDKDALAKLQPLAETLESEDVLSRFNLVLHISRGTMLDRGAQPYQAASLLVRLRNELVHYKSKWGVEHEQFKLLRSLEQLGLAPPPFRASASLFFPQRLLGAECALWAAQSSEAFFEGYYRALNVPNPVADIEKKMAGRVGRAV